MKHEAESKILILILFIIVVVVESCSCDGDSRKLLLKRCSKVFEKVLSFLKVFSSGQNHWVKKKKQHVMVPDGRFNVSLLYVSVGGKFR